VAPHSVTEISTFIIPGAEGLAGCGGRTGTHTDESHNDDKEVHIWLDMDSPCYHADIHTRSGLRGGQGRNKTCTALAIQSDITVPS